MNMKRYPRLKIHDTLYLLLEGRTIRDKVGVLSSCIPNFKSVFMDIARGLKESEYVYVKVDNNFAKGLGGLRLQSFNNRGEPSGGLDYYLVSDSNNEIRPRYLENHHLNLGTQDLKGLTVLCGNLLKAEGAFLVIRESYNDFEVTAYSTNLCGSEGIGVFHYGSILTAYNKEVLRPRFFDRVSLGKALNNLKKYYEGYYNIYTCYERNKYRVDVADRLGKLHPLAEIDESGNITPLGDIKKLPVGLLELVKLQKPLIRVHECIGIDVSYNSYSLFTDSKAYGTYRIRS